MNQSIIKFILAIALLISCKITAQNFYGEATYFSKTKVEDTDFGDSKMDPERKKQFNEAMRKALEKSYLLQFNKVESKYTEEEKLETPSAGGDGMSMSISMTGDFSKSYKNIQQLITISEEEIAGKEFLVTEPIKKWEWQMSDETKKIGEYTCQKATFTEPVPEEAKKEYEEMLAKKKDGKTMFFGLTEPKPKNIIAWYTSEIPVSHGPKNYWGLPGLIMEVNDGETTLLCTKVVLNTKNVKEIKVPKNGKKVTRKEFDKIDKDSFDKMKDNDGMIIQKVER